MRILLIGDVVGDPGRRILRECLPSLKSEYSPDLTIANGENLAGGLGATPQLIREITDYGVQVVTMGNHLLEDGSSILLPPREAGAGSSSAAGADPNQVSISRPSGDSR